MRSRAAIVLAVIAVGVWGIPAPLASSDRKTEPDRDELIRLENEWVTTTDPSFFERALADDEVHITRSGVMADKKAEIEFYRKHLAERQGQKTRFEDLKVRPTATSAS